MLLTTCTKKMPIALILGKALRDGLRLGLEALHITKHA